MVADMMGSLYEDKVFYEYQNYIVPSTGKFEYLDRRRPDG